MVVSNATRVRTREMDRVIELRPPQSIRSRGGTYASRGMRRSSYRTPVGRRSAGGADNMVFLCQAWYCLEDGTGWQAVAATWGVII